MKKNIIIKITAVFIMSTMVFTGCSGLSSNSKTNTQTSAQSKDQSSESKVEVTEQTKDTSSTDKTKENTTEATTESTSKQENTKETGNQDVLTTIKEQAAKGKVINCDYTANEAVTLSDIETALGSPDAQAAWIPSAAGYYETFSAKKLAFGANKGDAVFEIRSFDDSIKNITLKELEAKYGTPDYTVLANKERIIGYVVNSDYKLLFVFPQATGDESTWTLDHYSVFYPAGTANNMADYAGRDW